MKINYDTKMLEEIESLTYKPTLLLHVCCGPCSSYIVQELSQYFDITIYYSNSNIYPENEYIRRRDELKSFIEVLNSKGYSIDVIEDDYDLESYTKKLEPLKETGERGERCHLCYSMRMERAFHYANHHYDYWTTVLSVSPHKNSQWINEIGLSFQGDTKFLVSDFKKRNGYLKSTQTASEYGLYRQNYCGCVYSYEEMLKRENQK